MGAGQSSTASNAGLHVLRVAENSPSALSGVEPFFDIIVGYDGQPVTEEHEQFTAAVEIAEHAGISLVLQIWSTKREELRDVRVHPSRNWSISTRSVITHQDSQPSLLGLSLRLCKPEGQLEQVWHILDILEGSPAQAAGLVSYGDYVIGYAGGVLRGEGDFYHLIEQYIDRSLRLFVYNSDFDVTREVVIVPNRDWGNGDSLLGCGVGYGLLHRIPKPQDRQGLPAELSHPSPAHQSQAVFRQAALAEDEDDIESTGVQLVDTSRSASATPKSAANKAKTVNSRPVQTAYKQNAPSPLQSLSRNTSPVKLPPISPSARSFRSNSAVDIVEEEDEEDEGLI